LETVGLGQVDSLRLSDDSFLKLLESGVRNGVKG
jgi:hypothetical protein